MRKIRHKENDVLERWIWVMVFALAFAWVESAVVVYLREIYFNGTFEFPLIIKRVEGERIVDPIVWIEFGREIATIVMLVSIGWITGRSRLQRFCFFMIAFGIWDIFFYVWLDALTGWPESLMTWDLLFYVPLPWVGPVITPVLIALTMTVAGSLIIYYSAKGYAIQWRWWDLVIEFACGMLMITAFCWDWKNILQLPGDVPRTGIPNPFAWWLFIPAYIFSVLYFVIRLMQQLKSESRIMNIEC
jgi:hypothetical protein